MQKETRRKEEQRGGIITGERKGLEEIEEESNVNGMQERRLRVEGEI